MCRKCLYRLIVLLCLIGLPLALVAAQSGSVRITKTADALLDESQVRSAATALTGRNIRLGIYMVNQGNQSDFLRRLQADRLGNGREADSDVVAIYVSVDNRYSEIRWGQNFDNQLEPVGRDIRSTRLNPRLRDGRYTSAFVDTINAVDQVMAGTYVSSGSSGSSSSGGLNISGDTLLVIAGIIFFGSLWIYCQVSGNCNQGSSNNGYYDNSSSYTSSSSSYDSSSSSSSSSSSGGHDGGSWDD